MKRFSYAAIAALLLAVFAAGEASAITLTNRDKTDQRLTITEGGDEAVTQEVTIAVNETLDGICLEGCTIALENGTQESFEGDEAVTIEDGLFSIDE